MKSMLKCSKYYFVGFLLVLLFSSFKITYNEVVVKEQIESPYFNNTSITDGPYFFLEKNNVIVKWIYKDRLIEKHINGANYKIIKKKFGIDFQPEWIRESKDTVTDYVQRYNKVTKLIAISDIHGQYDVLVKLLKQHKVIDNNFNWSYGEGHLVVLGDIMDRGPKVTESLWLIYCLEKQAEKVGGKVHVLLGNHEVMVLNNDVRYTNEKYVKTAQLMSTTYSELFSKNTLLGRWLRKKPVMLTINDMLFVHAGVSVDFITQGFTRTGVNKSFNEKILGKSWNEILGDPSLTFMMGDKGPIWYRGYFDQPIVKEYQIDHLLRYFNVDHIIVGHTTIPNIISLYGNKVFGIDSSIKYGDYGEVFIYENENYYRGTINGNRIELK